MGDVKLWWPHFLPIDWMTCEFGLLLMPHKYCITSSLKTVLWYDWPNIGSTVHALAKCWTDYRESVCVRSPLVCQSGIILFMHVVLLNMIAACWMGALPCIRHSVGWGSYWSQHACLFLKLTKSSSDMFFLWNGEDQFILTLVWILVNFR